ncbi:nuclear transport factor 2 family protein [Rhizobium rhizogenes]|uniref:Nuclear transport factor 2 family protein n=1 Tax=Rhizobium rhizogenes TaxID=359 RepID=A0AA94V9N1_RHIRH|nr:nuclear transport factor 2 family protein [Rhizobium rhizogenes]TRA84994.1 nuclear transport factor 2 family protein [Rhizobium rhizogenes]
MDMPQIVNMYFDADTRNDADGLLQTLDVDAVVEDENARYQGSAAIRQWWVAAKSSAQYVAEPVETTVDGDKVLVRARVSGKFPGSPVMLIHAFTIKDDRIVRLEIRS